MPAFDESWLRSYQQRQSAGFVPTLPDQFGFTLPYTLKNLNVFLRLHWSDRSRYIRQVSADVAALIQHLPAGAPPIEHARVTVTRHALREPDADNLTGSCKSLLDVLQPRSDRHPHGLGLIQGDDPDHLELVVVCDPAAKRSEVRTVVLIERHPSKRRTA